MLISLEAMRAMGGDGVRLVKGMVKAVCGGIVAWIVAKVG